ncbi:type II secretion system secretin GspD [Desulforegula conservatrix]|uniref:type II secretion system secretin GspD n=1 Tax=Desulforegula conservatrix TaxID=153026 RepID=UPI0004260C32|nr:type II secretion system secretin GspD [Desulforegula conservatrix]
MYKFCGGNIGKRGAFAFLMKKSCFFLLIVLISSSVFLDRTSFSADEKQIQEEPSIPPEAVVNEDPDAAGPPEAVMNDEAKAVQPTPAPIEKSSGPGTASVKESKGQLKLDFNKADIRVFIKYISEHTGKNFIIDEKVKGFVTVHSPQPVTKDEAYQVFESVLEVNGYTTVDYGDYLKIIPVNEARTKNVETLVGTSQKNPEDKVVTQIIPLKYANPEELKRVLASLVSGGASMISYPPTGTLIVTDVSSNIQRILKIINNVDVPDVGQEISIIPLQNAEAGKLVKTLDNIFKDPKTANQPQIKKLGEYSPRFVADERVNTVIVMASEIETKRIRKLISMLDKEVPRGDEKVHVYYLEHASSEEMARVLQFMPSSSGSSSSGTSSFGSSATPTDGEEKKEQTFNRPSTNSSASASGGGSPISRDVKITADKSTNSLIIMADRQDYAVLEEIIKKLDIPRAMVLIECLIMEVSVEKEFSLGTEWMVMGETSIDGNKVGIGGGFGGAGYNNLTNTVKTGVLPQGTSLGIFSEEFVSIGGVKFPNIAAIIQAYKKDRDVNILSAPHVLGTDNQVSEIHVGKNVPYQTKVTTQGDLPYANYEYKNVGITLKIEPQISKDGRVKMKIYQEVTKLDELSKSSTMATTPTTFKRTIDTNVIVEDKNTVVIGGLIDNSFSETEYKVPCLGDIPGLGWLFKTLASGNERTNLFVFLTPHILRDTKDAKAIYDRKKKYINNVQGGKIEMYLDPGFEEAAGMKEKLFESKKKDHQKILDNKKDE